jgi:WD40 repeat protein
MRMIDFEEHPSGHAAPITHVAFRPDGARLATCSYDGTVIVWDTTTATRPVLLARLRHRRLVNAAAWHPTDPELLATASADKTVGVWRVPAAGPPQLVNALARHTDDVNSVAWLPDGERLACVSEDGRATLWHAFTGAYLTEVGIHTAHAMMVSASRHGLVATVGEDGLVAVVEPGRPGGPVTRGYAASVEGCAWSRSGKILAVARDDGAVDLLTPQLERLLTVQVCASAARTVDWSDDDASFVVGGYDGSLHVFDVTGDRRRTVRGPRVWPRSVSTAHGVIAAGSFGGTPHLFDLSTGATMSAPTTPTHGPNAMTVLGSELLIGCDSGTVLAVDLGDLSRARAMPLGDSPILSLASRDGVGYAGTYAGEVLAWHGAVVDRIDLGAPVPSLCSSGEGLIAGTYNGDLVALDPDSLAVLGRAVPHRGSVKSLAAVPGGFLSAATDRTVAVGTVDDRSTLWEHGNLVNAVATLGGVVVASASRDHTVKVGRLDRAAVQTLLGPDESVKCVGLLGDPAAPTVLAGSYDFGLWAWDVVWDDSAATLRSGRLLAEFRQGLSCMVALDAHRVAVAGWDGRILVVELTDGGALRIQHDLTVCDLMDRACQAVSA